MNYYLICFLACLGISVAIAPGVIFASKKFKASQTILHYVEAHKDKQGTPTMGGLIFIIAIMFALELLLNFRGVSRQFKVFCQRIRESGNLWNRKEQNVVGRNYAIRIGNQ